MKETIFVSSSVTTWKIAVFNNENVLKTFFEFSPQGPFCHPGSQILFFFSTTKLIMRYQFSENAKFFCASF